MNWFDLFTKVPEAVSGYFQKKEEAKIRRAELEAALQQKKLESIQKAEDYESAWNLAQIQNSGWKDEYWTIILSLPFIGAFIPFLVPYIIEGFAALDKMPGWYKYYVGLAIGAAFGFQQVVKIYKWWNTP